MRIKDVLFVDLPVKSYEVADDYAQILSDNSVAVDYIFKKKTGVDRNPKTNFYTPGLLCLANYIKAFGFTYDYVNLGVEDCDIVHIVKNYRFVAFSSLTVTIDDNINFAKMVKDSNPSIKVIIGGYHATYFAKELLTEFGFIDYVLIGEGERSLVYVLSGNYEGKGGIAYRNPDNEIICNLRAELLKSEEIPIPDYSLIAKHIDKYNIHVGTMRGCVGKCRFCVNHDYWGMPRLVALNKVEEEFRILSEILPEGSRIWITDNIFSYDAKRFNEMCNRIEKYCKKFILCCDTKASFLNDEIIDNFKRINVAQVSLGIEDCCDEILTKSLKGVTMRNNLEALKMINTKKYNIAVYAYWLVGLPGSTKETMLKNHATILSLLDEGLVDCISPKMFIPYPGTEFYCNSEQYGVHLRTDVEWKDYERKNIPLPYYYDSLTELEMYQELKQLMKDIINLYKRKWEIPDYLFVGAIPNDLPFSKSKK